MQIIDTHCHLDYIQESKNLDDVIEFAFKNKIEKMITISTKTSEFLEKILPIAEKYKNVYASIGTHPDSADLMDFDIDFVLDLCEKNKKIVGIGETGLDFYRPENPSEAVQIEMFERHAFVSEKTGLPIIFHSRNADRQTIDELKRLKCGQKFTCVMHCFAGSEWLAKSCLDLGCYLSFSGISTFKNATVIQDVIKFTPLDKILIETDAPFLAPIPHRGKPNEPAFLIHTAEFLAKHLEMDIKKFAGQVFKNSHKAFSRIPL